MSYSFKITQPTKVEAAVALRKQLDAISKAQPVHLHESDRVYDAAHSFLKMLTETPGMDFHLVVSTQVHGAGPKALSLIDVRIEARLVTHVDKPAHQDEVVQAGKPPAQNVPESGVGISTDTPNDGVAGQAPALQQIPTGRFEIPTGRFPTSGAEGGNQ